MSEHRKPIINPAAEGNLDHQTDRLVAVVERIVRRLATVEQTQVQSTPQRRPRKKAA